MTNLAANPYDLNIKELSELERELLLRLYFTSRRTVEMILLSMKSATEKGTDFSHLRPQLEARYDNSASTMEWIKDILEFAPQWDDYKDKLY